MKITFYPPNTLRIDPAEIAKSLENFDWVRLDKNGFYFRLSGQRRRAMSIDISSVDRANLIEHCNYCDKSFTAAIIQALTLTGLYKV